MPELANPSGEPIYKAWPMPQLKRRRKRQATTYVRTLPLSKPGMNDKISSLKWILGLIAAGVIGRFLSDFFAAENSALRSFAPAPG